MLHPMHQLLSPLANVMDAVDDAVMVRPDPSYLRFPRHWPAQADLLNFCHKIGPGVAVLLVVLGIVYLLFGLYIFRALVTLNAAILGAYFGAVLGQASNAAVPAAIVGGLLSACATWPIMKYAVAILGGVAGALLGATVWRLCALDPTFTWSGALTGLVFFGLLSFLLFRQCIMTYTSLQGAVMVVFGGISLAFRTDQIARLLNHSLATKQFLLPMAIFIPTLVGFVYQQAMFPLAGAEANPAPGKK
jgi:hypothetical protein